MNETTEKQINDKMCERINEKTFEMIKRIKE